MVLLLSRVMLLLLLLLMSGSGGGLRVLQVLNLLLRTHWTLLSLCPSLGCSTSLLLHCQLLCEQLMLLLVMLLLLLLLLLLSGSSLSG